MVVFSWYEIFGLVVFEVMVYGVVVVVSVCGGFSELIVYNESGLLVLL